MDRHCLVHLGAPRCCLKRNSAAQTQRRAEEQKLTARRRSTNKHMDAELVDRIDDLLPQTQCTQCGYAGCRPYALGDRLTVGADINQCPPGGDEGDSQAGVVVGPAYFKVAQSKPRNPDKPMLGSADRRALGVSVARCVFKPARWMPLWARPSACTPFCCSTAPAVSCASRPVPVDCIDLLPLEELVARGAAIPPTGPQPANSRARYLQRKARRLGDPSEETARSGDEQPEEVVGAPSMETRRAAVEAALNRARSRRANLG